MVAAVRGNHDQAWLHGDGLLQHDRRHLLRDGDLRPGRAEPLGPRDAAAQRRRGFTPSVLAAGEILGRCLALTDRKGTAFCPIHAAELARNRLKDR